MDFAYHTALDLTRLIATKKISPVELVEDVIERQTALELEINAFVTCTPDIALAAAKLAEQAVMAGGALGLFRQREKCPGDPVAVGDLPGRDPVVRDDKKPGLLQRLANRLHRHGPVRR